MTPGEPGLRETVLVYRDRLVPRSEAQFLRRSYVGFDRLSPVWIGCRTDEGLAELGSTPCLMGRAGRMGSWDRALFKQLGILPALPDLRALRPRLVHAHFGRGGALALPIARRLGIPLVVTFHGGDATKEAHYCPRVVPTIFQRRLARLQEETALFVCVSGFVRDRLIERGFPPGKLCVIHNGIEAAPDESAELAPVPPRALFVGRFVEKKGVRHLIEAMRLLEARGCPLELSLVGDGPLAPELLRQARGLDTVRFHGWLPPSEVRRRMRGALALCVPSVAAAGGDADGLPSVILEAMAAGLPVVASHSAGIAEAVEHGRTGLLVPPGDPASLAAALAVLLDAPALGRAMGEAARAAVALHFDAATQSHQLEDALVQVLAPRPH